VQIISLAALHFLPSGSLGENVEGADQTGRTSGALQSVHWLIGALLGLARDLSDFVPALKWTAQSPARRDMS
jgi:hypothetical protein